MGAEKHIGGKRLDGDYRSLRFVFYVISFSMLYHADDHQKGIGKLGLDCPCGNLTDRLGIMDLFFNRVCGEDLGDLSGNIIRDGTNFAPSLDFF